MWSESDGEMHDGRTGRSSAGSEVVMIDDKMIATSSRAAPNISNLNVTKSSRVHVGPKFVSVTQNVHNSEVIKGRFLGLELISPKDKHRLRCSVAVFVCWAFVVVSALAIYLFYFALSNQPQPARLDLDLPFPKYLWNIAKNSTRAEKLLCGVALIALIACIALILAFTLSTSNITGEVIDTAPHDWNITREMWLAKNATYTETLDNFKPLRLVIVQHTVSPECYQFEVCAAELRAMQNWFCDTYDYDIPYSFLIGNDGRVYEGRGWSVIGAHTYRYNRCSIGIGFIGDYREELAQHAVVTDLQIERTKMLLEEALRLGNLHPDYYLVGAKDLSKSESPGSSLYNAIREFPHYDFDVHYRNMTCEEIHALYDSRKT